MKLLSRIGYVIIGLLIIIVLWFVLSGKFDKKEPIDPLYTLRNNVESWQKSWEQSSMWENFNNRMLAYSKIVLIEKELDIWSKENKDQYLKEVVGLKEELRRLNEKLGLTFTDKYRIPEDLFYTFLKTDNAYVTQSPRDHDARNGFLATDVATSGRAIRVLAPDYLNNEEEYTVSYENYPATTGHTVILVSGNIRFLIGHVVSDRQLATVKTGEPIGSVGCTEGITTGCHVHIEVYVRADSGSPWQIVQYTLEDANKHEVIEQKKKQSSTVSKVEQVGSVDFSSYKNPKILAAVYQAESSSGRNDGCRNRGKYNGFGFGQHTSGWACFDSFDEVAGKVDNWFTDKLSKMSLNEALCLYNEGRQTTNCSYLAKNILHS